MGIENETIKYSNMNRLSDDWIGIDSIVLYGLGLVADRFIDKIIDDFNVLHIIDNKKSGASYRGVSVVKYADVSSLIKEKNIKIVVMTSQRVYDDIKRSLESDGLVEYKDFCRIQQFVVEWYYTNKGQLNIIQLNTAVTTWCTLSCEKCNMFLTHYDNSHRKHFSFEEMKGDIDAVLEYADYIFRYNFLGGEPLLNKDLKRIISYVGNNYKNRIGKLGITTNGTIIPDDETLECLKKYDVTVGISDYTLSVSYEDKLDRFIDILNRWNIPYIRNVMTEWKDYGFPEKPFHWGKDCVVQHMQKCAPLFHGINEKKIFYCHIIWSAEKAGIYTVPKQDYIDLTELNPKDMADKLKIIRYCNGECERGYLGLCMVCGGCGEDNDKIIPAGVQKR